jgi:putative PIN family toxin of toxin-antitoxin system
MIRVVIDTNILVSALLQPLGLPAQVFVLSLSGSIQLCVSGEVYAEHEEVISRPRFRRDAETIAATLRAIREQAFWVKPTDTVRACSDPDDDIFLECAQATQADYLVNRQSQTFPGSMGERADRDAPASARIDSGCRRKSIWISSAIWRGGGQQDGVLKT